MLKAVIHIEIDKEDMDLSFNDILSKLKKQDENQQTLPEDEKNTEDYYPNQSPIPKKPRKYFCNNPKCKKEITKSEVAFCLHKENKSRFKGKVYCLKCQEDY